MISRPSSKSINSPEIDTSSSPDRLIVRLLAEPWERASKRKGLALVFLLFMAGLMGAPQASADIVINAADDGPNVVFSYTGSLEQGTLDAFGGVISTGASFGPNTYIEGSARFARMHFRPGVATGTRYTVDLLALNLDFTQPLPDGLSLTADSVNGDFFLIDNELERMDLIVPDGYVGGSTISGSMTFNNTSLMAMGIDTSNTIQLFLPGADSESIFYYLFDVPDPVVPVALTPVAPELEPVVDYGALYSLTSSALPMNGAAGQIAGGVQQIGVNGLGSRLFRVRNRTTGGSGVAQAGSSFESRGRSVAASRYARFEERLEGEASIKLDGYRKPLETSSTLDPSGLSFDNPFSVTREAGVEASSGVVSSGSNWELFVSADFGSIKTDSLAATPGIESNTQAGTVGFEYQVNDTLNLGVGWSHLQNDNTLTNNLGGVDLEGNTGMAYATLFKNNLWADLLYSYGSYDVDISRNTGLGSTVRGDTDVSTHLTMLNLGYNIPAGDHIVHGPTFGAEYTDGQLNGYTETGDPRANTRFADQDFESLVTRLGWQVTWSGDTNIGVMTPQVRIGYGRENIDQDRNIAGTLVNSPFGPGLGGFTAGQMQTVPGEGWMDLGAGIGIQICPNIGLYVDYQTQLFREATTAQYGSVRAEIKF